MSNETRPAWHHITADEVLDKLGSHSDGLDEETARRRLEEHGPNKLDVKRRRTAIERFLEQFNNILIYILIAAAIVTALLAEWIDTAVIMAVVLINALVGFIQEGKAEKALEQISQMLTPTARVLRGGDTQEIKAEELVPGDVVLLNSGDKVPADLRLTEVRNLKIEESVLTGESQAVSKSVEPLEEDVVVNDQTNMAFSSTLVTYGQAKGVVTATAMNTEIGRISQMLTEEETIKTPLLRQIGQFGKWLSGYIVAFSIFLFMIAYFLRDYTLYDSLLAAISLAVAAIPEGLPAIITITLAIGVQELAKRNAIIRRLPAVETLGAITYICSDKTGTLTQNEMTVRTLLGPSGDYHVEGTGYEPKGDFHQDNKKVDPGDNRDICLLARTSLLCNEAGVQQNEDGEWVMRGDPTEGALVSMGLKAGIKTDDYKRLDVIPFESEHKFMATLDEHESGERYIHIKGAPERILEMCSGLYGDKDGRPFDPDQWKQRMEQTANRGERLIALAIKQAGRDQDTLEVSDIEEGVGLLGLAGMKDPPRKEATEAVRICRQAGIHVIMVTGDHVLTARAIADELGLETTQTMAGSELEDKSDEELRELVKTYRVFARTNPTHKLKLMKALQANGEVVAMTGDGVNDAPALKRADVGVAMGIKGTEVSKESSEVVLADDNFASIEKAIEQGRTIYDNIRKTILFILPTNGAEVLVVLTAILLGVMLPVIPVQILWINMVTAVTLALALAFEPTEADIMLRKPRDPNTPILSRYFVWRIVFVSVLISSFTLILHFRALDSGLDMPVSRTIAVNTLAAGQAFYLFNCRYMDRSVITVTGLLGSRYVLIAIAALVLLQLFLTYAPFMNAWFGTAPLLPAHWSAIVGAGLAVFLLVELEKLVVRAFFSR